MKNIIAILTITILSTCTLKAQLPKQGKLYKEDLEIHGVKIYNMTLRYTLSRSGTADIPSKLGMPTGSLGMEYNSEAKVSLAGCEPNIYLKLVRIDPKTNQKYIGWLKTPPVDAIHDSGKSLTGGTSAFEITGAPLGTEFQRLIRTSPRYNATFWPEENARSFYITAYVEDFEIEESPTCGARERMFNQKMRDNKLKENEIKNNAIQEANDKANSTATVLISQLPTSEQKYFQGRLSDIIQLAPHYQQKAYERLQNDLLTKTSEIEDQNTRKAALQTKRFEQESNLNKQLSEVNNLKDRAELGNRLEKLKQNRSSAIDMEYAQLESDIEKALKAEKRVNQEIAEFRNTYDSQNSDFKSRSGAMQTNVEMNRIQDDPSLSSVEKESQILQKQVQLNDNISIYNDDTRKIDQQKGEISEMKSENQATAGLAIGLVAILASVLTLGAIGQEVGEGHVWSQEAKIHPSFYIGASAMAVPLVANYDYWNEYNDGTLTSGAKIITQQTTGHKVVVSTGLGAGFENEFLLGNKAGISLFAEAGYHFINVDDAMSAIVDIIGGDASAGNTTYDEATTATTSKTTLLHYGGGMKGYIGAHDRPKLLWEASIAQNTGTHTYTYKYQYTGSAGNYSNVDTFHSGDISYQMSRAWIGCRFGDISDADVVLLDIKAGKEFTNNINFRKSAPWLFLISMHKPHRFMFSIFGSYGYFEDTSVSFSNKFNIGLKLARSFDWYK